MRLRGLMSRSCRRRARRRVLRWGYDAAKTTDENRRHWAQADLLSADATASPEVRKTLRARARYEVANNCYAHGIIHTIANDMVGRGPRLQMLTPDRDTNRQIEASFSEWADEIRLAEKLRIMRIARAESGEVFGLIARNPGLDSPVQLDLRLIEADQVATPMPTIEPGVVDGIEFDEYGNPVRYHVLRRHPGDTAAIVDVMAFDRVPASDMIHYYRPTRPGQSRGIPDITPALPLFAQLRRYTLAVLAAAETAAEFAAVLQSEAPADGAMDVEPMDLIELERRMATVLPSGWSLGQIRAEQPSTTYAEFKHELIDEIARCMLTPSHIARGNSSAYNFASGRLDHQTYHKSLHVERDLMRRQVIDRLFAAWLAEAVLIEGLLPQSMRRRGPLPRHMWFWDGFEHVDPLKEASAEASKLANGTTTLAAQYAAQGRDWEEELRQRARELRLMRELEEAEGISFSSKSTEDAGNERSQDAA